MSDATLLIVEDDGILAANLEIILTGLGYRVLGPVATGEEAIALLGEQPADLVLMDIELAGTLNGIETAERLSRSQDIPIVFLTGFSHDPLLAQAKVVAPYGYLIKPVPERELAVTIAMSLHRHSLDRELRESRKALAASEAKYRHLFEHSPLGIFRSTLDGRLLLANEEMARIIGFHSTSEAVAAITNIGRQVYVDPEKRRNFLELLREYGEVRSFEFQARRKNGETFWLSMDARLEHDPSLNTDGDRIIDGFAMDITTRKAAELALEESELRHRTYLMSTPYGIFVADLDGNIVQVNPSACRLSGYEEHELLAMTVADLHFPEYRDSAINSFQTAVREGQFQGEMPVRVKGGDCRWWSITSVNVVGRRILGFCNDITERKQVEAALEKRMLALLQPLNSVDEIAIEDLFNLAELQLIQDQFARATGVASLITRTDGTPITKPSNFSRLCSEIIRQSPIGLANCQHSDALVGRACLDGSTIQPCLSCGLWDAGAAIQVGGQHIANWLIGQVRNEAQTEEQMRAYARKIGADEEEFIAAFREVPAMPLQQFEAIASALFTLANQLSLSAYQNIQQARFIAERKQAEEKLQQSEARYRELVENANSIILRMDNEGRLTFFNEFAQRFFGYSAEEVLGKNVLGTIVPETESTGRDLRAMIADLGCHPERYATNENENMRRDGSRVWVSWTNRILYNAAGEASELLCVGNDITERRQAEEDKRHLQAQLNQAQKIEAIGTLAGGIAHDFNNILAAVIGYADIAREEVADGSFLAKNIDQILKAGHRAKDLVKQILAFSRQSSIEATVFMPAIIIREAVKLLRPSLPSTIKIEQHIDLKAGPICIDPTQFHQILMNLCTNAFHAMEGEGGTLTIGLGALFLDEAALPTSAQGGAGEYVVLSVADTGVGIPEAILTRIFDPFFTTKEAGKGTGMGLSIIHGIVTARGGFIVVDSTVGKGSVFRIHLPVTAQEVGRSRDEAWDAPGGSGHILFVDDETMLVEMATNVLQKLGYLVTARTSSSEALATFKEDPSRYDLVITDQTMPGMTGLELSHRLLALRPDLPIILCTGYGAQLNRDDVCKQGIRELVLKPLTKKELAGIVKKVLDPR